MLDVFISRHEDIETSCACMHWCASGFSVVRGCGASLCWDTIADWCSWHEGEHIGWLDKEKRPQQAGRERAKRVAFQKQLTYSVSAWMSCPDRRQQFPSCAMKLSHTDTKPINSFVCFAILPGISLPARLTHTMHPWYLKIATASPTAVTTTTTTTVMVRS